MITFTPPFYLSGESGTVLGASPRSLSSLGVTDAVLVLCSLDMDVLTWTMHPRISPLLPDPEQLVTLWDDKDQRLFSGYVKRAQDLISRRYSYTAESVWKRLSNAPIKGVTDDRPYRVYQEQDLALTLRDLLLLAQADGLPVQPPAAADMPTIYKVPKMGLRSKSYVDAILEVLKYVPDLGTRMDYSTSPPTMRFIRRDRQAIHRIDLDVAGHGITGGKLEPKPWLRALGIEIHYARRLSASTIQEFTQTAGDPEAEAGRQINLMLSGFERTDTLAAEGLTTALASLHDAQAALDAVGASASASAATAQLPLSWDTCKTRDSNLVTALGMGAFTMVPAGGNYSLYINESYTQGTTTRSYSSTALALYRASGAVASGWYPVRSDAFTTEQLTIAGAVKESGSIKGQLLFDRTDPASTPAGVASLTTTGISGWKVQGGMGENMPFSNFYFYATVTPVDIINMSPTAVAAAVVAALEAQKSTLVDQANFVEAPAGMAQNYFNAQDWTPMDGSLAFSPAATWMPAPTDRVQIEGTDIDPQWGQAEAVTKSITVTLHTGAVSASMGAPPRQAVTSLMDKLRVPVEDNFQ